jgi:tellurite resistance protein TehA-like permease
MNNVTMTMVAGIMFGIWPIILKKSGLEGTVASLVYTLGVFFLILLYLFVWEGRIMDRETIVKSHWLPVVPAVIIGAIGLVMFNTVIARADGKQVGQLFALMIVAQICIPAGYDVYMNGNMTVSKILGYIAAVIAAILLFR